MKKLVDEFIDQSEAVEKGDISPSEEESAQVPRQHLVELQRMNRALRLLSSVNQTLTHVSMEEELMQLTCDIAVDIGGYRLAWVGFAEQDEAQTVRVICHAGHEEGFLHEQHFSWADDENCDPAGMAIRTRNPSIQANISSISMCALWRDAALVRGYQSSIALPLQFEEQVIGALTLYDGSSYTFSAEEIALLKELANDLSYGISALRTRKRQLYAEEALRLSEQRLHSIITTAPFGAHEYELRPDGRLIFISFNPAAQRILGVEHENFLGKSIEEAFPSLVGTAIPEAYRHVAKTGEPFEDDQVNYEQGKISGAFEIAAFQTAPDRMAVFFRDITERRRVEEALRASEEKFAKTFHTSPDAININRLSDGVFLDINKGFTDLTGFTREDVIGYSSLSEGIDIWVHPEDRQRLLAALRKHGEMLGLEAEFRHKDGSTTFGSMSAKMIELNGEQCILSITRDITERKRAEEAIKRESSFLASVIELLPFPIFIVTPTHEVIRQNRASLALQHVPDSLLLGEVEFIDPQTYTACPPRDWPILHALRGEIEPTREYILRQQDGREMPILLQTAPIVIAGEIVAAVVAIQDISALKEADSAKNQFLMALSHEMRTPLTSIIGWAQLAQGASDVVSEALKSIIQNARTQNILLERLLILSRILTGKLRIAKQSTDLWQLVLHVVQQLQQRMEEHHITLHLEPPADALHLDADSKLLEQAIDEIMDNALHFTPAGGVISIQGRLADEQIVLVVTDTGSGMVPEQIATRLKPFTQIQRKEEIGGLGIGFSLVRGIIEAHQGRVEITSAGPGQGTTVTCRLPRSNAERV